MSTSASACFSACVSNSSARDGSATPAKKRTRRGSRGGKNRRKKPAVAADGTMTAGAATETLEREETPPAQPDAGQRPESDEATEPAAERESEPEPVREPEAEQEAPAEPSPNGDGDWTYTPMSQWGDSD